MKRIYPKWSQRDDLRLSNASGQVVSKRNIWIKSLKTTQTSRLNITPEDGTDPQHFSEVCELCGRPFYKLEKGKGADKRHVKLPALNNDQCLVNLEEANQISKNSCENQNSGKKDLEYLRLDSRPSLKAKVRDGQKNDRLPLIFRKIKNSTEYCKCAEFRDKITTTRNSLLREDRDPEIVKLCRFPVDASDIPPNDIVQLYKGSKQNPLSCTYLVGNIRKKYLSLANHRLGEHCDGILQVIAAGKLTVLDLSGNELGEEGVNQLVRGMLMNKSVRDLNLSNNELGACFALTSLAKLLDKSSTLEVLSVAENRLTDLDVEPLINAATSNSTLRRLDLHSNHLGELGCDFLSNLLKTNNVLEELDLGCNKIGPCGSRKIFEGLEVNSGLLKLNVSSNAIGDRGMDELSTVTGLGTDLVFLDMSDNVLTNYGVKTFSRLLGNDSSLRILKLDRNAFGSEGLYFILLQLLCSQHSVLTQLYTGAIFLDERLKSILQRIEEKRDFNILSSNGMGSDSSNAFRVLDMYLDQHRLIERT